MLAFVEIGRSTLISAELRPLSKLDSEVRHFGVFGVGFEEISLAGKLAVNAIIMLNMTITLTMDCWNNGLKNRRMRHNTIPFLGVWLLLWGLDFLLTDTMQGLFFVELSFD